MGRFYSIPGCRPGGSEHRGPDPEKVDAMLRAKNPEFYAERDRRRGESSVVSGFTPGDEVSFGDHSAVVEHVERDGARERLWMRGEKTGTYISNWERTGDGSAAISDARPTRD